MCIFVPEFIDSATALLISASVPAVIVYLVVLSHAYCLYKKVVALLCAAAPGLTVIVI